MFLCLFFIFHVLYLPVPRLQQPADLFAWVSGLLVPFLSSGQRQSADYTLAFTSRTCRRFWSSSARKLHKPGGRVGFGRRGVAHVADIIYFTTDRKTILSTNRPPGSLVRVGCTPRKPGRRGGISLWHRERKKLQAYATARALADIIHSPSDTIVYRRNRSDSFSSVSYHESYPPYLRSILCRYRKYVIPHVR